MDTLTHTMHDLFVQLGLETDAKSIDNFFRYHYLNRYQSLHNAEFWNESQAGFIRENWQNDAEWVQLIDQLDVMLRH